MASKALHVLQAALVSLLMWLYFLFGFVLVFAPLYVAAGLAARDRARRFQRLNRRFCAVFFGLLGLVVPRLRWRVDAALGDIRSSVVICNHISFLDPLVLYGLLDRAVTIVKGRFFRLPVMHWVLNGAGCIPDSTRGPKEPLVSRFAGLEAHLRSGGNLFVFPEGTRKPVGQLGDFLPGAFKLARRYRVPLELLFIRNSHDLFPPSTFFLRTWAPRGIEVVHLGRVQPDYDDPSFDLGSWMQAVRAVYEERLARDRSVPYSP